MTEKLAELYLSYISLYHSGKNRHVYQSKLISLKFNLHNKYKSCRILIISSSNQLQKSSSNIVANILPLAVKGTIFPWPSLSFSKFEKFPSYEKLSGSLRSASRSANKLIIKILLALYIHIPSQISGPKFTTICNPRPPGIKLNFQRKFPPRAIRIYTSVRSTDHFTRVVALSTGAKKKFAQKFTITPGRAPSLTAHAAALVSAPKGCCCFIATSSLVLPLF